MASNNPYMIEPANPLAALMVGVQGYDRAQKASKEEAMKAGRLEAVQALQSGGDPRGALAKLIGIGDVQGANAIANYAQNEAQQKNADRSFGLQSKQLDATISNQQATRGLAERQFEWQRQNSPQAELKTVKDANGNESLVRVDRQGNLTPLTPGGGASTPNNPFANGKMTGEQGKVATYLDRMAESDEVIKKNEGINQGAGGFIEGSVVRGPLKDSAIVNSMISKERQQVNQAQRNFINSVLRRESGAVISEQEFANARQQYFPQPGDGPDVIKQKAQNRTTAMQGFAREAGPSYTPPASLTGAQRAVPAAQPGTTSSGVSWRIVQ